MTQPSRFAAGPYGRFSDDGREYVITDPRTPRPWVNVVANPRAGFVVSQTGSGFSFLENSQLAVVTRWQQDLVEDVSGKFLYVKDAEDGGVWSLSPAPVWAPFDSFACRHGFGYTTFETARAGIETEWTLFCHAQEMVEIWRVALRNASGRPRRLRPVGRTSSGAAASRPPRGGSSRSSSSRRASTPRAAPSSRATTCGRCLRSATGTGTRAFPYASAFATSGEPVSALGDKAAFLGRYGGLRAPAAIFGKAGASAFGRHEDPVAALEVEVVLAPGETRTLGFALASAESEDAAAGLAARFTKAEESGPALQAVVEGWRARLAAHRDGDSGPGAGRARERLGPLPGDRGAALGPLRLLPAERRVRFPRPAPGLAGLADDRSRPLPRRRSGSTPAHQFADGSVYHWWHPLTEQGHVTKMTDDFLWLAVRRGELHRETGRLLHPRRRGAVPRRRRRATPLSEHVSRAFRRVFARTSPRGIPLIGAGDWNDGLSALGLEERGESVWLGHFLAGLLGRVGEIRPPLGRRRASRGSSPARREALVERHQHPRLGRRAGTGAGTLDDGACRSADRADRVGRIFLNAQTWAILNDVAPPDRAAACLAAVKEHLVTRGGRAPARAGLRPSGPGDRLHHPLRARPARERRRLHARRDLGDRRRREGEGRRARRAGSSPRSTRRTRTPSATVAEPYVLPGQRRRARLAAPRPRGLDLVHGLGGVAAPRRCGVGARRAAGVGRPARSTRACRRLGRAAMVRPWRGATLEIAIERGVPARPAATAPCSRSTAFPSRRVLAAPERRRRRAGRGDDRLGLRTGASSAAPRAPDDLRVEARARLGRAPLRGVVDVDDAEALREAVRPLEVVEERPGEVAAEVDAARDALARAARRWSRR